MKVSDCIVQFFVHKGITDVFGYPGGMVTHLMDSFEKEKNIKAHLCYHEQAAAFAACGYAQASGKVGVAYATSGPGVTNLLTGIAHAYFDSVPTIFITGQVNTYEQKGTVSVRQKGFQEMEVVNLVRSITKYAVSVKTPEQLIVALKRAYAIANTGRKGPVVIDLPMNVQRGSINQDLMDSLLAPEAEGTELCFVPKFDCDGRGILTKALTSSKRPLIVAGAGISTSQTSALFREVVEHLGIPVVTSMIAVDALPSSSKLNYGFLGAYGHRYANFIVSKADLILSVGSRLDCRQTGNDKKIFASEAKIVRIDIDVDELTNIVHDDEEHIVADLRDVLTYLRKFPKLNGLEPWISQCNEYRRALSVFDQTEGNVLAKQIGFLIPNSSVITTDVGQNQVWVAQSFPIRENQKVLFSGGHGAMGFSFPAAIGAYYASRKPVFSFNGDGGFQMNLQELQFLAREKIPLKIIIMNNRSLGMIRHFQEMYFESKFAHTMHEHGYSAPEFAAIAQAYGLPSARFDSDHVDWSEVQTLLEADGPALIDFEMSDTTFTFPKLAMGKPLYDQEPPLDRDLLNRLLEFPGK